MAGTGPPSGDAPGRTPALGLSCSEAPSTLTANMPGAEWPTATHDSPVKRPVGAISARRDLQPLPTPCRLPEPHTGPRGHQAQAQGFPAENKPRPPRPRSSSENRQSHLCSGDRCLRKPPESHKCLPSALTHTLFHSNRPPAHISAPHKSSCVLRASVSSQFNQQGLLFRGLEISGAPYNGRHLRAGDQWGINTDTGTQGELEVRLWNEKFPFPMEGGSHYPRQVCLSNIRQQYRADFPKWEAFDLKMFRLHLSFCQHAGPLCLLTCECE